MASGNHVSPHFGYRNRQQTIRNDFYTDVAHNEISYDYAALRGQKLYWSLPSQFTGNRVSYSLNVTSILLLATVSKLQVGVSHL